MASAHQGRDGDAVGEGCDQGLGVSGGGDNVILGLNDEDRSRASADPGGFVGGGPRRPLRAHHLRMPTT